MTKASLSKQRITSLLRNGISEEAVLLHGTSVEAVLHLFQTGKLPTGVKSGWPGEPTYGFLYFAPIMERLKNSPLSVMFGEYSHSFNWAHTIASLYAKFNAQRRYTAEVLRKIGVSEEHIEILAMWYALGIDSRKIPKREADKAFKVLDDMRVYWELERRGGVVLGINTKVLKLNMKVYARSDVFEGLRAYSPRGLASSYISGIEPQKGTDSRLIRAWLRKAS